jgi:acetyl-CoA carboxylase biotin carboxyl carrier protein
VATNDLARLTESVTLESTAETVRKLAEVLSDHGLAKIEVSFSGLQIRLSAGKPAAVVAAPVPAAAPVAPSEPLEVPGHIVAAPMIGTYYAAPSPGDPPFVEIGDAVEVGQTIGIIEAMKIMNEITSDRAGVVAEIFARNSEAVEYGSPLIRIIPA